MTVVPAAAPAHSADMNTAPALPLFLFLSAACPIDGDDTTYTPPLTTSITATDPTSSSGDSGDTSSDGGTSEDTGSSGGESSSGDDTGHGCAIGEGCDREAANADNFCEAVHTLGLVHEVDDSYLKIVDDACVSGKPACALCFDLYNYCVQIGVACDGLQEMCTCLGDKFDAP